MNDKRTLETHGSHVRNASSETRKGVEELLEENRRLATALADIEAQHERHTEQYVLVEEQNAKLANLYVASFRLHGTVLRGEVLEAIQEIIINLIGSEEHAVFAVPSPAERNPAERQTLQLLASFGVDRARFESIGLDEGIVGYVARTGERYFPPDETVPVTPTPDEENLTVCIPLKLEGDVIAVIAIFRLLPQKAALEATDHELLDLLATQAATALAFADLYASRRFRKGA